MLAEWQRIWPHLVYGTMLFVLVGAVWAFRLRLAALQRVCERERRGREEMEAYVRLDTRMRREGDIRGLGSRVCRAIKAKSNFRRVAMMARDGYGKLHLVGREGLDDEVVAAAERAVKVLFGGGWKDALRMGESSAVVPLEGYQGRILVVPIGTVDEWRSGSGVLLLCADSILEVPRRLADEAVIGVEALAVKLAMTLEGRPGLFARHVGRKVYPLKVVAKKDAGELKDAGVYL